MDSPNPTGSTEVEAEAAKAEIVALVAHWYMDADVPMGEMVAELIEAGWPVEDYAQVVVFRADVEARRQRDFEEYELHLLEQAQHQAKWRRFRRSGRWKRRPRRVAPMPRGWRLGAARHRERRSQTVRRGGGRSSRAGPRLADDPDPPSRGWPWRDGDCICDRLTLAALGALV